MSYRANIENDYLFIGCMLSVASHLLILLMFFPMFDFSFNSRVLELTSAALENYVEVNLVPDFVAYKPEDQAIQTDNPEPQNNVVDDQEQSGVVKTKELSLNNAPLANEIKSTAPERYEQILARHFANSIHPSSRSVKSSNGVIMVWIKINRSGNIIGHGTLGRNIDPEIVNWLALVINKASPVPPPPAESFKKDYVSYKIPIKIKH